MHCYEKRGSDTYCKPITQHFILNFAKISTFQAETSVYVKSYQSEILLKVVINNTQTIGLQRSLTCQNSYSDIS